MTQENSNKVEFTITDSVTGAVVSSSQVIMQKKGGGELGSSAFYQMSELFRLMKEDFKNNPRSSTHYIKG